MKNISISSILAAIALFSMQGCSLDEFNTRTPVADTYYMTEDGASDLVNSAYAYAQTIYSVQMWYLTELGTDLWMIGGDGPKDINNYTFDASHANITEVWDNCYKGITACNTLLDRADNIDAGSDVVDNYKGQAYFLRAYFYHILVMQFGDLPLVLHEVTAVETTATRNAVSDVYKQIIADLKEAESLLPETPTEFGRRHSLWHKRCWLVFVFGTNNGARLPLMLKRSLTQVTTIYCQTLRNYGLRIIKKIKNSFGAFKALPMILIIRRVVGPLPYLRFVMMSMGQIMAWSVI